MSLDPIRTIEKRGGERVSFDAERIRVAVAGAQAAVGERDPAFPVEVAELVEFALRRRYGLADPRAEADAVPSVEEIQDLVELALIELGRAAVAKAYILYRDRRARVRQSQSVPARSDEGRAPQNLRVREAERSSPWSKGRIIAALVDEAGLSRARAEEVAKRVERRVVHSGLRRISTGLVRELVDNELVDLGLSKALARHEPVAVARHDLRQLLESGPRPPAHGVGRPPRVVPGERIAEDSVEGAIAGAVLRRVALEDLLSEDLAERHARGDLHLEDVRRPHLHLVQSLPAELCQRGRPGPSAAFELLDELARLTASVSRGIVLEQPGTLLTPLVRGARSESAAGLRSWLGALRALCRASGRRVDLSRIGTRSPGLLARLVDELGALAGSPEPGPVPRMFLNREELHTLLSQRGEDGRADVLRLFTAGVLIPSWSRTDELFVGPGCRRRGREPGAVACGGAVALNLARVARRAGPWREDLALEGLAELVEAAVTTLAELASFQRDARAARAGEARGRIAYAITPVGLREALRILGDGELKSSQGARLLGLISDASRRFAARRGLSVVLSPFFGRRAAARFAEFDSERPQESQGLLFEELARTAADRERDYSLGFDLGSFLEPGEDQARGPRMAELLSTVATGAWLEPAVLYGHALRPAPVGDPLETWVNFDRAREERGALARAAANPNETGGLVPSASDASGASDLFFSDPHAPATE